MKPERRFEHTRPHNLHYNSDETLTHTTTVTSLPPLPFFSIPPPIHPSVSEHAGWFPWRQTRGTPAKKQAILPQNTVLWWRTIPTVIIQPSSDKTFVFLLSSPDLSSLYTSVFKTKKKTVRMGPKITDHPGFSQKEKGSSRDFLLFANWKKRCCRQRRTNKTPKC